MPNNPFAPIPANPREHFKLYFYAAILEFLDQVSQAVGSAEAVFERFPFLVGYNNELALGGLDGLSYGQAARVWLDSLAIWEKTTAAHLPLRALREAADLDPAAIAVLIGVGLIEEDARFGAIFESLHGLAGQPRATPGLLNAWWRNENGTTDAHATLRRLIELGMVRTVNPEAPRLNQALEIPGPLWDALRGEPTEQVTAWGRYRRADQLIPLDELILPQGLRAQMVSLPDLLESGQIQALVVRGPQHNGRRTLLGGMARALGRGLLEINGLTRSDDERWRLIGPLATALNALPVFVIALGTEETFPVPRLAAYDGPLGIVMGKQGGVNGDGVASAFICTLEMPDWQARRLHWQQACGEDKVGDIQDIAGRFRLTGGNIRRAAHMAGSYAALAGRAAITPGDVRQATRALNRQSLDSLAQRLEASGDWDRLAVGQDTRRELENLESRCRHRERLCEHVGVGLAQLNSGVRALLSGPSGTGKTLAARLLASVLEKDLYRLDLSSVVNKYIGETEKNLNQILSCAEELDIILLLDEGDALLTQRTNIQTSNDRYANLETNFLLQRLESFEGILIVTTNAGDRIDNAFQRRMDLVIPFRAPDVEERRAIWRLHLPASHAIPDNWMEEVARRCELNGGQIRNAVLHTSLLTLNDGGIMTAPLLTRAIQREYRKVGAVCPL